MQILAKAVQSHSFLPVANSDVSVARNYVQPLIEKANLGEVRATIGLDSGSSSRKGVEVQVLSSAPTKSIIYNQFPRLS